MKLATRMPCSSLFCHRKEVVLSRQLYLFVYFSSCRLSRYFSTLCQVLITKMIMSDFSYRVKLDLLHKQGEQDTKKVHPGRATGCHFVLASHTAGPRKHSLSWLSSNLLVSSR